MYLVSFFWYVIISLVILLIVNKNIKRVSAAEEVSTGKDTLLHFGMFLTLMLTIATFLIMLFDAIDAKFVDPLNSYNGYFSEAMSSEQAIMISTLVVVFPLFLVFAFLIAKEIKKNPIKKDLSMRRSVIYTLLVASTVTVVGTLITTIYNWLLGSTTDSFILKALIIVLMSVVLFFYFFYSLKRDYIKETFVPNIMALVSLVLVVSGVVWSVNVIGSPSKTRDIKLDEQKLQDLKGIENNIQYYVQSHNTLPSSLRDMSDKYSYSLNISDKETGKDYGYTPGSFASTTSSSEFSYKLCATFHLASDKSNGNYYWRAHEAGYQCFDIEDRIMK